MQWFAIKKSLVCLDKFRTVVTFVVGKHASHQSLPYASGQHAPAGVVLA